MHGQKKGLLQYLTFNMNKNINDVRGKKSESDVIVEKNHTSFACVSHFSVAQSWSVAMPNEFFYLLHVY